MRVVVYCAVLCVFLSGAGCSQPDIDGTGLVKVSGHVYAFIAPGPSAWEGLGANSGFVVGSEAVLVVDSRYTPHLANELLEAVRSVTDCPVRYLVNTHYHPDHTWGNAVFRDAGARIIARVETARDLEENTPVYLEYYRNRRPEVYAELKDIDLALPDSTFENRLSIDLGRVEVVLEFLGPGHTAGDCVVSVPAERVAFTGGLVVNGYHPNLGDGGADLECWLEALGRLEEMRLRRLVPAQGKVCGASVIGENSRYIETLRELCIERIRGSVSVGDAAFDVKVPGTEGYLQENLLPFNVQAIFRSEVLRVVQPGFTMNMPIEFTVADGGGGAKNGRIRWSRESFKTVLEVEVNWQPTVRSEVIVQDVHDRVARFLAADGIHDMQIMGSRRILVGDEEAPASYGRWAYKRDSGYMGGGVWTWAVIVRNGKLYTIKFSANTGNDRAAEERSMKMLESIVSTFRTDRD